MPADHGSVEGVSNTDVPPETGGDLPF